MLLGEHHVRGVFHHDELRIRKPRRHVFRGADGASTVVAAGEDQHRMGHLVEAVFDVNAAVVLSGEVADDVWCVASQPGGPTTVFLQRRASRFPEMERQLVVEQRPGLVFALVSLASGMGPPRCHEHGTTWKCR